MEAACSVAVFISLHSSGPSYPVATVCGPEPARECYATGFWSSPVLIGEGDCRLFIPLEEQHLGVSGCVPWPAAPHAARR